MLRKLIAIVLLSMMITTGALANGRPNSDGTALVHVQGEQLPVVTVTISAAGDCTLGGDVPGGSYSRFARYYDENGAAYFLANVRDIFAGDDLTIVNLEGTFTESDNRQDKTFAFKGKAEYASILTCGSVEAVSIDNNHTQDYGAQSTTDTMQVLDDYGIGYAGLGEFWGTEINGVRIGFLSYRSWNMSRSGMEADVRKLRTVCDMVIVAIHWGVEKEGMANNSQINLGHAAIDAGADLVLGHHPHVVQGIEVYKGRYICYSLGNFCFGGNKNPADKDTFIFRGTYSFTGGNLVASDIAIIPCSVSSVGNTNNYQPTPLTMENGGRRVFEKLQARSARFGDTIDWNAAVKKYMEELPASEE